MLKWIVGIVCAAGTLGMVRGAEQAGKTSAPTLRALVDEFETAVKASKVATDAEPFIQKLTSLGLKAAPEMVEMLKPCFAKDRVASGSLMIALSRMKARVATPLLAKFAVEHPDHNKRRFALDILQQLGDTAAIPLLRPGLVMPDKLSRKETIQFQDTLEATVKTLQALARGLGGASVLAQALQKDLVNTTQAEKFRYIQVLKEIDARDADEILLRLTMDASLNVRCDAMHALGMKGTRRNGSQLAGYLGAGEPKMRAVTAIALGHLKYTPAIPQLIRMLSEKDAEVSQGAIWALRNITGMSFAPDVPRWTLWFDEEKARTESHMAGLVDRISTGSAELAPIAVEEIATLVLLRDRWMDILAPFGQHSNPHVRAAICNVLAQSGDARAYPYLLARLKERDDAVSFGAWRALKYMTGKNVSKDYDAWVLALKERG